MKRLIVALTVAFMFVAGSAFAATWNGHLYGSVVCADFTGGLIAPIPEADFTMDFDGVLNTSSVPTSWTVMGEEGPETVTGWWRQTDMNWDMDGVASVQGDALIPQATNVYYGGALTVVIVADGTDQNLNMNIIRKFIYDGSGDYYDASNWGKSSVDANVEPRQSYVNCTVNGTPYALAVYGISINSAATTATHVEGMMWLSQAFDGAADASGSYRWVANSAVPIPGAAWLLLSGLVGLVGLRKRS